ncbi:unnamed protein product [Albugo candida]|uniref:Uncharacterized protein n=1 Tax=Albugo candida TaxID=65357 RepID=A0A024FY93_9STRA|nr:unnamed protein product [Albugo candida]|eukprot:CCI39466.1 unnamed protein product [Albugo candida]
MADATTFPERFLSCDEAIVFQTHCIWMCSSFGTHYQHSLDQLELVLMPSLHLFASVLFLQDGSSSTGDSKVKKMSLVYQHFGFHALCWNICWQNTIQISILAFLLWIPIARGPEFDAAARKSLARLCYSNGKTLYIRRRITQSAT